MRNLKISMNMGKKFSKKDFVLFSVLLMIAFLGILILKISNSTPGKSVIVTIDGEIVGEYALEEEQYFQVVTDSGKNRIRVQDGEVYVEEADCPDQYCVKHMPIRKSGEMIVCLPHKLIIEVVDE